MFEQTSNWLASGARSIAYTFALISLGSLAALIVFGRSITGPQLSPEAVPPVGLLGEATQASQQTLGIGEILGATAGICAVLFAIFWLLAVVLRSPRQRIPH